jgi:DNA repair ATPase RecN
MALIEIHNHGCSVEELYAINQKLNAIMATEAEFNEKFDTIIGGLDNIKEDLDGLKAEIGTLGLNAATEARMFARVDAIAQRVTAIADETPDAPVEPEEPTEEG